MYYVDMIKKRTLLGKPKALTAFCSIFMLLCLATEATAQSGFVTPEKVQLTGGKGYDGLALQVGSLDEGIDDMRCYAPPDGESYENCLVLCKVCRRCLEFRT